MKSGRQHAGIAHTLKIARQISHASAAAPKVWGGWRANGVSVRACACVYCNITIWGLQLLTGENKRLIWVNGVGGGYPPFFPASFSVSSIIHLLYYLVHHPVPSPSALLSFSAHAHRALLLSPSPCALSLQ